MSTDLAVIEAALKAATPGPWKYEPPDGRHGGAPWIDADPMPVSEFYGTLADARLIANAPTWLAELVERVKMAEAEVERLRELLDQVRLGRWDARDRVILIGAHSALQRAEAAEAAIERVRALADRFKAGGFTSVYESAQELGEMIADALDGDL